MPRTIHVIGAGLSGLAAAVKLVAGHKVVVHEATEHAGGRCRSYYDHATGLTIDNGNHLLLSANRAALDYTETIGSRAGLTGPPAAEFPFYDLATGKRWSVQINDGRLPRWIFDTHRRVPETRPLDYLRLVPLMWAGWKRTVGEVIDCNGALYDRLVQPVFLAALNIDPREGSAKLAGAIVRETLAAGGLACRPLIARDGLSYVMVEPALAYLRERQGTIRFRHELRALRFADGRVDALDFGGDFVPLAPGDAVILAVPPWSAASLVPRLTAPSEFRAIVNGHFRIDRPQDFPPMIGVLNGMVEWIFGFPGRLSVTISGADRLLATPREELAETMWREVARVAGLAPSEQPLWQIVRERRATFAATPGQNAKRPTAETTWSNLFLAGDWTATGLPATIEGAIRSGNSAAALAERRQ